MTAARQASAIRMDAVIRRFGTFAALDGVSLEIPRGEFMALAGHNGAGKSTLFKVLLGLLPPDSGSIDVLGGDPYGTDSRSLRRKLSFLPENVTFSGNLTGREMMRFFARLKGAPRAECDALLEEVGLSDAAAKRVRTYSKGMRQRLGLAQMLLGNARLLILDEPTTGLDPESRRHLFEVLRARQQDGATILLSSHTLAEVEDYADRIAILRSGRLAACGSLEALLRDSGLPILIQVEAQGGNAAGIANGLEDIAKVRLCNGSRIELECAPDRQTVVLKRLGETGAVGRIDVRAPRLAEVYHHYQDRETSA